MPGFRGQCPRRALASGRCSGPRRRHPVDKAPTAQPSLTVRRPGRSRRRGPGGAARSSGAPAHLDKALTAGIFADGERDIAVGDQGLGRRSAGHEDRVDCRPCGRNRPALPRQRDDRDTHPYRYRRGHRHSRRRGGAVCPGQTALVIDLQVVAACSVPVTGVARANGPPSCPLSTSGPTLVGGAPGSDADPSQCLDFLLAVAPERGLPVDLHVDETSDPGTFTLPALADRAAASRSPSQPATA